MSKYLTKFTTIHVSPSLDSLTFIFVFLSASFQGSQLGYQSVWTAWSHCSQSSQRALWKSWLKPRMEFGPLHFRPAQEESGGPG